MYELGREYRGTVSSFCRSCREQELFDRFLITERHELTDETETRFVRVCQGCSYEEDEQGGKVSKK